ncbi:PQQ-dependent sugar dehydrogenase [Haloarchaeobius sp. DT45]|uniref:PQQ-dependent sugar dehydrogenase n=1 Tax=Haloarchaeobius sp. DT45 TaxID=3446116 RepID=UPI003F6D89DE
MSGDSTGSSSRRSFLRSLGTGSAGLALAGAGTARVDAAGTFDGTGTTAALAFSQEGFVDEVVVEGLAGPVSLVFAPDGRLFVGERGGRVLSVDTATDTLPVTPVPLLTIPNVATTGDAGVTTLAVHPAFDSNGRLYVYYSNAQSGRNRISWFDASGPTADPSSETVVWQKINPRISFFPNLLGRHYGGAMAFDSDTNLLLAIGDGFVNPLNAQDVTNVDGSIIRLTDDGEIPDDNPYVDVSRARPEIWAKGLRNPFRGSFDPVLDRFILGDVGSNNQVTSREYVFVGERDANYGWPLCEVESPLCNGVRTQSSWFFYRHNLQPASITGGLVYRGDAFPEEFDGAYFYGDFVRGFIRYLTLDGQGTVTGDFDFATDVGPVVDFDVGPDGFLYYVSIAGTVNRIRPDTA